MIDLETMDTLPSTKVLSIGAVAFNPYTGEVETDTGLHIALRQDLQLGRTKSPQTEAWWERQSPEARASWDLPEEDLVEPKEALRELYRFFKTNKASRPWGHGSTFDISILEDMYRWAEGKPPWRFWDVADTRTILDIAKMKVPRVEGTHHNALDDAINQAKAMHIAYQKLGLVK